MKCANCGAEIADDCSFCPKCGDPVVIIEAEVDMSEVSRPVPPQPKPTPKPEPKPEANTASQQDAEAIEKTVCALQELLAWRKTYRNRVLWTIFLSPVLLVAAFAGWAAMGYRDTLLFMGMFAVCVIIFCFILYALVMRNKTIHRLKALCLLVSIDYDNLENIIAAYRAQHPTHKRFNVGIIINWGKLFYYIIVLGLFAALAAFRIAMRHH